MLDMIASGQQVDGVWTSGIDNVIVDAYTESGAPLVPIVGADNAGFVTQLATVEGLVGAAVTNPGDRRRRRRHAGARHPQRQPAGSPGRRGVALRPRRPRDHGQQHRGGQGAHRGGPEPEPRPRVAGRPAGPRVDHVHGRRRSSRARARANSPTLELDGPRGCGRPSTPPRCHVPPRPRAIGR